eukprot:CAMPEP_0171936994 /NCGR_PEP_ID=MMETSP0993-20121228/34232_1 /TAXON_ID=483369 /ORGANISM="non described non described, Strain CCMP2098" /LENGTH=58 /DNA_ID=CAMNT_0012578263 /DNA_START=275 /DNA_END=451 /DNA_ORIENTATION=-
MGASPCCLGSLTEPKSRGGSSAEAPGSGRRSRKSQKRPQTPPQQEPQAEPGVIGATAA